MNTAQTIYRDPGTRVMAVPVATECGEPAAFILGLAYQAGPIPNTVRPPHCWSAVPDGTCGGGWKNDATGHSFEA
jgi:hypothetical protein